MRLLGEELPFSENVVYIFDKQIEEAPLLIINKIDLLDEVEAEELAILARNRYPEKSILMSNSHNAEDVKLWVRQIETENLESSWKSLDMDYQRYGEGESQLAWLDEVVKIEAPRVNARDLAILLISTILNGLQTEKAAIGHLKFLLSADDGEVKVSFTSLKQPDWQSQIPPLYGTRLTVAMNARVEIAAQRLHEIIRSAVQNTADAGGGMWSESDLEYFHPGFPNPTHRIE
jgi:G3E family GTPase